MIVRNLIAKLFTSTNSLLYLTHIYVYIILYLLVCGLDHDFYFSIDLECHHPNWLIFFRGVGQPPSSLSYVVGCFNQFWFPWLSSLTNLWQETQETLLRQEMAARCFSRHLDEGFHKGGTQHGWFIVYNGKTMETHGKSIYQWMIRWLYRCEVKGKIPNSQAVSIMFFLGKAWFHDVGWCVLTAN